MNAQEIRSLIEQKIAGQGTNVDAGGALPAILEALVDAVTPLFVEIRNIAQVSSEEALLLYDFYKRGLIANVILRDETGRCAKIAAWTVLEDDSASFYYVDPSSGAISRAFYEW